MGGGGNPQAQTGGPTIGVPPNQSGGFGNPQAQSGTPLFGMPPQQFGGFGMPQAQTQNEPFWQGQRPFFNEQMPQRLNNRPVDYLRALRMGGRPNQIDATDFNARYPQFRAAGGGNMSVQ
jgi:hypothetical protein